MAFAKAVSFLCAHQPMPDTSVATAAHALSAEPLSAAELSGAAALLLTAALRRRSSMLESERPFDWLKCQGNAASEAADNVAAGCYYSAALVARPIARERAITLANRSAMWLAAGFPDCSVNDAAAGVLADPTYAKAWFRLANALGHGDAEGGWGAAAKRHAAALLTSTHSRAASDAAEAAGELADAISVAATPVYRALCAAQAPRHAASLSAGGASSPRDELALERPKAWDKDEPHGCCRVAVRRDCGDCSRGRELCVDSPPRPPTSPPSAALPPPRACSGAAAEAPPPPGPLPPGTVLLRERPLASIGLSPVPRQRDWLLAKATGTGPALPSSSGSSWRCSHCLGPLQQLLLCRAKCRHADPRLSPMAQHCDRQRGPADRLQRAAGCVCTETACEPIVYAIPCSGGCEEGAAAGLWCSARCMVRSWQREHWRECGSRRVTSVARAAASVQRAGCPPAAASADEDALGRQWAHHAAAMSCLPAEVLLALRCMDAGGSACGSLEGPFDAPSTRLPPSSGALQACCGCGVPPWECPLPAEGPPTVPPSSLSAVIAAAVPLQAIDADLPRAQASELAVTAALTRAILVAAAAATDLRVPAAADGSGRTGGAAPLADAVALGTGALRRQARPPPPPCAVRLARWLCILVCNAHGVKTLVSAHGKDDGERGETVVEAFGEVTVGLALVRAASLANHACVPAALSRFSFSGGACVLELVALRPLGPGATVTLSYGPDALTEPDTHVRRQWLRRRYAFVCRCPACVEEPTLTPAAAEEAAELQRLFASARDSAASGRIAAAVASQREFVRLRQERLERLIGLEEASLAHPRSDTRSGELGSRTGCAKVPSEPQWRPHPELGHDLAALAELLRTQAQPLVAVGDAPMRKGTAGLGLASGTAGASDAQAEIAEVAAAARAALRVLDRSRDSESRRRSQPESASNAIDSASGLGGASASGAGTPLPVAAASPQ